ncbi:MAG: TMEM175 family protein [Candidatus Omnitrophica bacterium]|nr:TMEM175 family protein [Candidatus Omnitrophota bacterium]MDD5487861.1 TMEM175 family protein [Candidatus Omnitrophota bacterium]
MVNDGIIEDKGPQRIEALSDGIFAIAMTILVLSFEVIFDPERSYSNEALVAMLSGLLPDLIYYVMSFMILGIFWIQHHNQFKFIKKSNASLILINIVWLMFITLIPFTTAIVGDHHNTLIAALLFEVNLLLAGMFFALNWIYATSGKRLVQQALDDRMIKWYRKRSLIIPVWSILAIVISLFDPGLGTTVYFTVPVVLYVYVRKTEKYYRRSIV